MKTLKSQINNNLKKELFSLNQLVKFATKGDGKEYIKTYIAKIERWRKGNNQEKYLL